MSYGHQYFITTNLFLILFNYMFEKSLPVRRLSKSYFAPIHIEPLHNFSISSYTTYRFENHYVISQFDPILIIRLRNHVVVSLSIRLRNHVVVFQFGPIPIIRLIITMWFLKNYESQKLNIFIFRIICWRRRWDKLNDFLNSSTDNFFAIKNPYRALRP